VRRRSAARHTRQRGVLGCAAVECAQDVWSHCYSMCHFCDAVLACESQCATMTCIRRGCRAPLWYVQTPQTIILGSLLRDGMFGSFTRCDVCTFLWLPAIFLPLSTPSKQESIRICAKNIFSPQKFGLSLLCSALLCSGSTRVAREFSDKIDTQSG